jgi:hypothetical protein
MREKRKIKNEKAREKCQKCLVFPMFLVVLREEFEAFSKGFLQQKSKLSLNYNKLVVRKEI